MKNIIYAAIISLFIIGLISCKKKENTPSESKESVNAQITLTSPMEGDTIANGDMVHIMGTITGISELHGYQLTLLKTQNDSILAQETSEDHLTNYTLHMMYLNNFAADTDLKVRVIAEIDHDGNTITKTVNLVAKGN